ncbi:transcriptional activator hac1 protein [Stemphylium lycopersici]|uniref:Transcriptional activator hac1 protein n=1 Tax=Stemphylium lycopersici TaxID=183478 RepID=A0A364NG50_STELY|nr:transcriptional activator hac1 protein [Stemphylium lycopersici]RAR16259.1 transcriptional activator hac1 protein [Stemphylium lycopersici]
MAQQIFDSSLFSHTMNTSTITSTPLPPPSLASPPASDTMMPTTIKMEMIENLDSSPSPAHDSSASSEPPQTPAPEANGSKPVKKRKSWGQVLPEPKTSLPPRKRAKTEDEKEQRRIERVKRNRLAAHNSRERKRQEYEVLQTEKDELEANMQAYKEKMAQMEAELRYFRSKYPGEAPQATFDLSTPPRDSFDTICPAQIPTSFPSPESMDSMDSPLSVDFGNLSTGDLGLPFSVQPYPTVDDKPILMENFFDFDQFPKCSPTTTTPMEPAFSMVDSSSVDVFGSTVFDHSSHSNSYGFLDGFDAKFNDLQSASGATSVSDEALAAGQL